MNQHEIEAGYPYDGNPEEDIASIKFYEKAVDNIQDAGKRNKIQETLKELKDCVLVHVNK